MCHRSLSVCSQWGRHLKSFALSQGMTASIGVILCRESFMILKTDILILRLQDSTVFHSKVSRVASNREPMINIVSF